MLMSLYFLWRALRSLKQENGPIRLSVRKIIIDTVWRMHWMGGNWRKRQHYLLPALLTSHPCQVEVWFREKYLWGLFVVHQGKGNWRQLCGDLHCHEGTMDYLGASCCSWRSCTWLWQCGLKCVFSVQVLIPAHLHWRWWHGLELLSFSL